jgi:hypothetical protein
MHQHAAHAMHNLATSAAVTHTAAAVLLLLLQLVPLPQQCVLPHAQAGAARRQQQPRSRTTAAAAVDGPSAGGAAAGRAGRAGQGGAQSSRGRRQPPGAWLCIHTAGGLDYPSPATLLTTFVRKHRITLDVVLQLSIAVVNLCLVLHVQAGEQAAAAAGSMHGILSPLDELQYWADLAASAGAGVLTAGSSPDASVSPCAAAAQGARSWCVAACRYMAPEVLS